MLKSFPVRCVEVGEQLAQLVVGNEPRRSLLGIFLDMAAGVGPVGAIAPDLGEIEHLAEASEGPVRDDRSIRHRGHQAGDVGPRYLMNLHPAKPGNDVVLDVEFVARNRARLVVQLGIVLNELVAEPLHGRGCARR